MNCPFCSNQRNPSYRRNAPLKFCSYLTLYENPEFRRLATDIAPSLDIPIARRQRITAEAFYQIMIGRMLVAAEEDLLSVFKNSQVMRQIAEMMLYTNRSPTYRVYPGIADALITTNIDIPCSEVQIPFDAFTIQLPEDTEIRSPRTGKQLCSILIARLSEFFISGLRITAPDDTRIIMLWQNGRNEDDLDEGYFIFNLGRENTVEEECQEVRSLIISGEGTQSEADDAGAIELQQLFRLVIGTIFMAISKDRCYVERERVIIRGRNICPCGSGEMFRRCCSRTDDLIGYNIGKEIILASEQSPGRQVIVEGRGSPLSYGHIRSGHMRWQWYNDDAGVRRRKLIFVHPTIVRPDLPIKPRLTPRGIRRVDPPNNRQNPWYPW